MNIKELAKNCGVTEDQCAFQLAIDLMTDEQRIKLREKLENMGVEKLPRNLFYNYSTQKWIDRTSEV